MKVQDIEELETELEKKQTQNIELTSKQKERIEKLQELHKKELATTIEKHEKALSDLEKGYRLEIDEL